MSDDAPSLGRRWASHELVGGPIKEAIPVLYHIQSRSIKSNRLQIILNVEIVARPPFQLVREELNPFEDSLPKGRERDERRKRRRKCPRVRQPP